MEFFSAEILERFPACRKEWLSAEVFFLLTAGTPLEYGTKAVVERESEIKAILGRDAFFDSEDPYRIARGPEYPLAFKRWIRDPEEEWISKAGPSWEAYPNE